jgi:hypothetical protein
LSQIGFESFNARCQILHVSVCAIDCPIRQIVRDKSQWLDYTAIADRDSRANHGRASNETTLADSCLYLAVGASALAGIG